MKRFAAMILALMMLFSLCACGSTDTTGSQKTAQETQAPAEIRKPQENNETPKGTQAGDGTKAGADDSGGKQSETVYTIAGEVIVDDENCTFIIKKAETDPIWGFTLKAYCENKTSDKTLMFSIYDVSVNGYMTDPFWAEEVAPGKKSNDDISFPSSDFDEIGITSADEIVFSLRVFDYDDWTAEDLVHGVYAVYPTGLSADAVVCPERKTTASEQVIIDNDDVSFIILDQRDDSIWGCTFDCYLENKTDSTLMFSWDDVGVNGYMVDPFWAAEVAPGMRKYSGVSFPSSDFDEIGITAADEINFTLRIYDSYDWLADDYVKDVYAVYPTGLSADTVVYPERKTAASEQVVIDNDEFSFIILRQRDDGTWGYTLDCYLENKTDASLVFSWDSVSVNGYMIDPYWGTEIAPGMRKYSSISFSPQDFEENGITEVNEIVFFLRVYDPDNWSTDYTSKEAFVFKP